MQASWMEVMRQVFDNAGYDIDVVGINAIGAEDTQTLLSERCSFDLLQDTSSENVWSRMGGKKDDFFIYRPGGTLAPSGYLPYLGMSSTNLSTEDGWNNVATRTVAAHDLGPVRSCASCAFRIEKGTVSAGRRGTSVKLSRAFFDPGIERYSSTGEDVSITIHGREYLSASSTRQVKVNRKGSKIAVKASTGKLIIDLAKNRIKLALKGIPAGEIDASDGLAVSVAVGAVSFHLQTTTVARGRKLLIEPASGDFELAPGYSPCP